MAIAGAEADRRALLAGAADHSTGARKPMGAGASPVSFVSFSDILPSFQVAVLNFPGEAEVFDITKTCSLSVAVSSVMKQVHCLPY